MCLGAEPNPPIDKHRLRNCDNSSPILRTNPRTVRCCLMYMGSQDEWEDELVREFGAHWRQYNRIEQIETVWGTQFICNVCAESRGQDKQLTAAVFGITLQVASTKM